MKKVHLDFQFAKGVYGIFTTECGRFKKGIISVKEDKFKHTFIKHRCRLCQRNRRQK